MYVTVYHSAEDAWLRPQAVYNLWLLQVDVPQNLGLNPCPLIGCGYLWSLVG